MASTAGTKSIFADNAGTSLVEATCHTTGPAATVVALASTILMISTMATVGGPSHDDSTNNMTTDIVTMGILAIKAGTPMYNATQTATTMIMAPRTSVPRRI